MKVYLLREERYILADCGEHSELDYVNILVFSSFKKTYNKMLELAEEIKKEYNEDDDYNYLNKKYEIRLSKDNCEICCAEIDYDYHNLIIEEREIL